MGQKVNPISFRLGLQEEWRSRWFKVKNLAQFLKEDYQIRKAIKKRFKEAAIARIDIEREATDITVIIYTARPGILIGRKGAGTVEIKKMVENITGGKVKIDVVEIKNPDANAQLLADFIKEQIEKRVVPRRAMKLAIDRAIAAKVKGIKIEVAGRISGAEIARSEKLSYGRVPLTTIRSKVDYGFAEAQTIYGTLGVKVWLYFGETASQKPEPEEKLT
jgi:small subunit ribosomal protein S3